MRISANPPCKRSDDYPGHIQKRGNGLHFERSETVSGGEDYSPFWRAGGCISKETLQLFCYNNILEMNYEVPDM